MDWFSKIFRSFLRSSTEGGEVKKQEEQDESVLPYPTDPHGMQMVMAVGDIGDPTKLPPSNDEIIFVSGEGKTQVASCGHEAQKILAFEVFGEKVSCDDWRVCPTCGVEELKKQVIRCARCGLPILPGGGVAVYHPRSPEIRKETAHYLDEETVLGCIRWDCCPSGGFFAGHWMGEPDGFKSALSSSEEEPEEVHPS